ncbi:MAG: hypothetical protein ABGZ35_13575 [Planctomycetaceae bacterium]
MPSNTRTWKQGCVVVLVMCGVMLSLLQSSKLHGGDDREVWEYTGGTGRSWFTHVADKKWVVHLGNSKTVLNIEVGRTADSITLRNPANGLWTRLHDEHGELRRSSDGPWKRWSAKGKWVPRSALPKHAVDFDDYQVRVIYFVPSDREPIEAYEAKLRVVLAYVEELYRTSASLRRHRMDRLPFERDGDDIRIHLVRADQPAAFFNTGWQKQDGTQLKRLADYIREHEYDPARRTTLIFPETWEAGPAEYAWPGHIGRASLYSPEGGFAAYSAWILQDMFCATSIEKQHRLFLDRTPVPGRRSFVVQGHNAPVFEFVENGIGGVAHELGHALGLPHDNRRSANNIMGGGFRNIRFNFDPKAPRSRRVGISIDNARLLMSSRYLADDVSLDDFDPPQIETTIQRTRSGQFQFAINLKDNSELKALVVARFDAANAQDCDLFGTRFALRNVESWFIRRIYSRSL